MCDEVVAASELAEENRPLVEVAAGGAERHPPEYRDAAEPHQKLARSVASAGGRAALSRAASMACTRRSWVCFYVVIPGDR